jgi:hypothetical protein
MVARLARLELAQHFVEGAADAVLIAHQLRENLAAGVVAEGLAEEACVFVVGRLADRPAGAGGLKAVHENAGFDADEAAKPPIGRGELVDERFLAGANRRETRNHARQEGVVLRLVFTGDDRVAAAQTVDAAVAADGGFAFGSFGAGAEGGVAAIGVDLSLRGHDRSRTSHSTAHASPKRRAQATWCRHGE